MCTSAVAFWVKRISSHVEKKRIFAGFEIWKKQRERDILNIAAKQVFQPSLRCLKAKAEDNPSFARLCTQRGRPFVMVSPCANLD